MKAKLVGDKLIVNSRRYSIETLKDIPSELQLKNLATRELESAILFNGKNSQYSNFYSCKFILEGKVFNSVENYFQYQKAYHLGDSNAADLIMCSDDPVQQMRIGRRLPEDKQLWNDTIAEQTMEIGIKAKFEQDPENRFYKLAPNCLLTVTCMKNSGLMVLI